MRTKGMGDFVSEGIVHRDDQLNPGGGGCIWEVGQPESSAVCTPINGGHNMTPSTTNARGQFDYKAPKPVVESVQSVQSVQSDESDEREDKIKKRFIA
jgi:hypothetical protein